MNRIEDWNSLLHQLYNLKKETDLKSEGEESIELIKTVVIPNNLSYKKCMENYVIQDEYSYLDMIPSNMGTKSNLTILVHKGMNALPSQYNKFFLACFPDVYKWLNENLKSDRDLIELNNQTVLFQNLYINNNNRFTCFAYMELCNLYKRKFSGFETQ